MFRVRVQALLGGRVMAPVLLLPSKLSFFYQPTHFLLLLSKIEFLAAHPLSPTSKQIEFVELLTHFLLLPSNSVKVLITSFGFHAKFASNFWLMQRAMKKLYFLHRSPLKITCEMMLWNFIKWDHATWKQAELVEHSWDTNSDFLCPDHVPDCRFVTASGWVAFPFRNFLLPSKNMQPLIDNSLGKLISFEFSSFLCYFFLLSGL